MQSIAWWILARGLAWAVEVDAPLNLNTIQIIQSSYGSFSYAVEGCNTWDRCFRARCQIDDKRYLNEARTVDFDQALCVDPAFSSLREIVCMRDVPAKTLCHFVH